MLENSKIIVDIDSCTKCNACVDECHYYYFDSGVLCLNDEADEYCIECGKCVAVCPTHAIRLKTHKDKFLRDVPKKEDLPTFESISNLFQTRRSRRQFKDKSVPRELIEKILNVAGRYSATASNQENVYFTVVQDREILKKISNDLNNLVKNLVETFEDPQGRKTLESTFPPKFIKKLEKVIPSFKRRLKRITQGEEVWRWDAEIIIIHSPKDALSLEENCALAAGQIMLAAETLELGTCSLGYITNLFNNFKSIAKIVKIPMKHVVGYTLAIGYPKAHYFRIPTRKPLKVKWF
ncbi:MAG: nitroreductase family protein [Candidatus Hodarchaeota archaeon]